MRKKAQEQKMNASPPCTSSSSRSPSSMTNELPSNTGGRTGDVSVKIGKNDGVKDYSMDHVWKEIATPEELSGLSFEQCKEEVCSTYNGCVIAASPAWEYNTSDTLWHIDDQDLKSLNQGDHLLDSINFQHEKHPWYFPV